MKHQNSGSSRAALLAVITVIGALVLMMFPTLATGAWKLLGWLAVGASAVSSGAFYNIEKAQKVLAEKEKQRQLYKRNKNRQKERLAKEKKLEKTKENYEKKEKRQADKRAQAKLKIIEQAEVVWSERVEHAKAQEHSIRSMVDKIVQMAARDAAGQLAIEWNEATGLAQWTMQRIDMFARQPAAKTEAREEEQDAIIESIAFKENGGLWTLEKGNKLASIKEKARIEEQVEEKRVDTMRNTLDNADIKWRASERRIERWTEELNKASSAGNK